MKIKISRKGFRCPYCSKNRTGAYRIVDGLKSCEKCTREYEYVPQVKYAICPTCKGLGKLLAK